MRIFSAGSERDFSFVCGRLGWPNTTKWKASRGDGKASMEAWARRLWRNSAWDPTPPTGEKNGRKRSVLVDARGVPLSLVASGANVHDVKLLEVTLESIVFPRPKTNICATESLCMDAGYVGYAAMVTMRNHGYQQNLKSRKQETEEKTRTPGHKARRWVVERTHSWFNRFRKLLVSFEIGLGGSHLSSPATPPDMRVRIRRFGRIELLANEQSGNSKRVEVWDRKRIVHCGTVGYPPWTVTASGCLRSQIRSHSMLP
jgi:putative transposase